MATKPKQWKVGTVVRLKSGGPPMTVTQPTNEGGECFCTWFPTDTVEDASGAEFVADALMEAEPRE